MYRKMYIGIMSEHVSFTNLRQNLADHLDKVEHDHVELVVTRQNREPVVIVSLADWESMQETLYLLSNQANASRLIASIEELNRGGGQEHELIEP